MSFFTFLVVVAGWLVSLCLHEYAHARVAYMGSDLSVKEKGYLSLNPIRYADPVLSLLMPMLFLAFGGIGLPGAAVYIDHRRLRGRGWWTAVSLAGPGMNILLTGMLVVFIRLLPPALAFLGPGLAFLAQLEVMSVLLSLVPVPPLDGYGALSPFLNRRVAYYLNRAGTWTLWALVLVLWFVEPAGAAFWNAVNDVAASVGVPLDLATEGYRQYMTILRP